MTSKSLKWNGKALTERMRTAQKLGVNKVLADSVVHAKLNHPWRNRTVTLEGDIIVGEFAHEVPGGVEGTWGVAKGSKQALILEFGGTIVPVKAKALRFQLPDGTWVIAKSVRIPAFPYLRPAADATYPTLAGHIRKAFENLGGSEGAAQ